MPSLTSSSDRIDPKGPKAWVRHIAFGFTMGSADVVPGISGGTVAFVVGIYARLIDAIRDASRIVPLALKADVKGVVNAIKNLDFGLVVPLLIGIGAAVLTLAAIIEKGLDEYPIELAGLFFGLVTASAVVAWRLIRKPNAKLIGLSMLAAIVFFVLLGFVSDTSATSDDTSSAALWFFFGAGAIAICAMMLPGISGSFLLVIMGMYGNVLAAVNDRDFGTVLVFLLGCITGVLAFSRVLAYLLENHHDIVVALMTGLMVGSMRILWPWPEGTATTTLAAPSDTLLVPIGLAVLGIAAVFGLTRAGALKEEKLPHPG